ncbi:MAG: metallophosphoesterase family protein [Akkermansiaceae bacterium]|nr:metallophosphoesterase family protein [Armatimonadota bacterium]
MNESEPKLLNRIGVIGDPHAEDGRLAEAIRFLQSDGVDALFCTGDAVTGKGDANRCCHLLEENQVHTVRGNHDRWFFTDAYADMLPDTTPSEALDLRARAFLQTLPQTLPFETVRGPLQLAHGTDIDDMLAVYPGDGRWVLEANWKLQRLYAERRYRILVGGHTHARMVRAFDHLTLLNPGTLRRDQSPGFLVADFAAGVAVFYDFDNAGVVSPGETVPLPKPPEELP